MPRQPCSRTCLVHDAADRGRHRARGPARAHRLGAGAHRRASRARVAGALLAAAGLGMLAWTVTLFIRIGRGTLAPWDPTRKLVVRGPYAHVRNPMITGVLAILIGEALAFAPDPCGRGPR